MQEKINEEKLKSDWQEETNNVVKLDKGRVADYWIEKIKQSNLALLEEVEASVKDFLKTPEYNKEQTYEKALRHVLSTLSKHKERLSEK